VFSLGKYPRKNYSLLFAGFIRGAIQSKTALKIFHHESLTSWDGHMPWVSLAFNMATHESTKCPPDKLFF